jgi:hypothetical protein
MSDHDPVIVGLDLNAAPSADAGGPYTVTEGGSVTLNATGTDPEGSEVTFEWDLDGDGTFETAGQSVQFAPSAQAPATLTVTVRVTDAAGKSATDEATVSVTYRFTGFYQPVDNAPTVNVVKAGQAVPIKFSLTGDQGLAIFADGYPKIDFTACTVGSTDTIETTTTGNSSLSYSPISDQYTYIWKTSKAWAGTCGALELKFIDGTSQTAAFQFAK